MLATVYGDVHDIGKSLVNTILSNNGYTVFDLGKQVPVNTIIDKAVEVERRRDRPVGAARLDVEADAAVRAGARQARACRFPVLIGGAAINRRFGRRALFVEGERAYESGRLLLQGCVRGAGDDGGARRIRERREEFVGEECSTRRASDVFLRTHGRQGHRGRRRRRTRAATSPRDNPVPDAAVLGRARRARHPARRGVRAARPRRAVSPAVGRARLGRPSTRRRCENEFEPTLDAAQGRREARTGGSSRRRCTATSRCSRPGNDLIVYDPAAYASDGGSLREIARFHFPRRKDASGCASPTTSGRVESGDVDVAAFQIVTVGDEATRRFETLQARGEYTEAFYSHGLAVEAAEAVAEWMHRRIRRELGLPAGRGKRYSWGYRRVPRPRGPRERCSSSCPPREALGMELTEAFQLLPEQSTAAIIVHHPGSEVLRRSRGVAQPRDPQAAVGSRVASMTQPALRIARELLDPDRVVVFDGAMGTMLYAKGVFINQCYDELNLARRTSCATCTART